MKRKSATCGFALNCSLHTASRALASGRLTKLGNGTFVNGASICCQRNRHNKRVMTGRKADRVRVVSCMAPTSTQEGGLDVLWPGFAAKMKESGEIPGYDEWHGLLDGCVEAKDEADKAIWVLNLMRDTGRVPTAGTYERALACCALHEDRVGAFHLVEHMYKDKVLLGDVELPDGMERTLRSILPPEAFE